MNIRVFIIDSFTSEQFRGNPTPVCCLREDISRSTMASIARQLNFPVTAFMQPLSNLPDQFAIWYFTPAMEIPACGHATLAAAYVAFTDRKVADVSFCTTSEIVINVANIEGILTMSYPKYDTIPFQVNHQLLDSLQISSYLFAGYCAELETLFLELHTAEILRRIQPDFDLMMQSNKEIKEVIVTSASDDPRYDFLLRSFCPWIGINEDPVTGSVFSVLAGFWKQKSGKSIMKAYQASERGGEVTINNFEDKVLIGGNCVLFLSGELEI